MGFTRLKRKDRAIKYKNLIRLARLDGNEAEELQALKEWIGVAKQEFSREQAAEVLFFIYRNVTKDQELEDFLMDTYGEEK